MGISSSKSTTKPVYNAQIEGAGKTLTNAYNVNAPKIQAMTDSITGLAPDLIDRFKNGDTGVNAAKAYNLNVLQGQYLDAGNPYMEGIISQSNNDIKNQMQAALGARGLTGGSDYAGIISNNIAKNTLATRYQNYDAERNRMATAAGQSSQLASTDYLPIASLLGVSEAANDPMQAAVGYSSGMGGLLGQYTQTKTKNAWGPLLAQAAANAAAAYAGGG